MVITECLRQRRWIVLVMALSVMVIALSSYLAYRELCKILKEHDILLQYGSLFLSPKDIARLNATTHSSPVPDDPNDRKFDGFCFSNCSSKNVYQPYPKSEDALRRNLRTQPQENLFNETGNSSFAENGPRFGRVRQHPTDLVHHACCNTRRRIITPVRVQNVYGEDRLVVQFRNRNQVFFTDECYQARGCTGCQCTQMMATFAAVVIDDDGRYDNPKQPRRRNFAGYRLELIRVPGCCKCLNNLT